MAVRVDVGGDALSHAPVARRELVGSDADSDQDFGIAKVDDPATDGIPQRDAHQSERVAGDSQIIGIDVPPAVVLYQLGNSVLRRLSQVKYPARRTGQIEPALALARVHIAGREGLAVVRLRSPRECSPEPD